MIFLKKIHSQLVYFCLPVFLLVGVVSAGAKERGMLDDFVLMTSHESLLLYFSVKNAFTDEMEKGIKNGIPVTFTFVLELYQQQKGSPDREIISHTFEHTLNYDSLKQEYQVEMEEKKGRISSVKKLSTAKLLMTDINDFSLVDLAMLNKGSTYLVKVKAKLAEKKLPLNFQYIVPFWKLWKFETDWYSLTFTYAKSGSAITR